MNRLQKKCLIAIAGTHLLVIVLLFCSGFIASKPKTDDVPLLDIIPSNVIEAAAHSGVKNAPKPPPTQPTPPVSKPIEPTPPEPKPPTPVKPEPAEPVKPPVTPTGEEPTPVVKPKPKPVHTVVPNLTHTITHVVKPTVIKPTEDPEAAAEAKAEAAAEKARERRAHALASALNNISEHSSSATRVEMPGSGSVSYASYASVVKSIYEHAWTPPDDTSSDDANTKVSVTIANDGHVIESHIINPSGDSRVDASVRRTLDRVTFVHEFPDGAKEREKTFIINFNLKAKRMNG